MNRYAMSIIEMPLEIYPDGSYKQLPDRAHVRFELLTRIPEINELPKTVPLHEVLASNEREEREKEIRIRTIIPEPPMEKSPVAEEEFAEEPEPEDTEEDQDPEVNPEPECGFISLAEIQSAAPKRPAHSRTFKSLGSFASRFSRKTVK